MMDALSFILGAFAGGVMGGSISAIALNIPGTAAAVATIFDGYPLKLRGEANNALGIALFVSFLGGIFGIICLGIFGPLLGSIALKFGSQEYFLITLWGISLVAILSKGHMVKGFIAALIGFFVGMIGMDPITGLMRFTMGTGFLSGGVHFVVALIGLFGMKEVFSQLSSATSFKTDASYRIRDLLPKWPILRKIMPSIIWSSPIGYIIGVLPGTGGDIGALVSYGVTKQLVKNPSRPFGEGAYEGVAAPEAANDSAMGGAITTMLTLGIPGDSVTAVILGSFYLHGLVPGPTFMMTDPQYFKMTIVFLTLGVTFAYVFGLLGSNVMLRAINIPKNYLLPIIAILCIVGSFAIQNSINDVLFMLIFGLIGYAFEKSGYPVSPMVLAIILGGMIETSFRQALINTGDMTSLLLSLVTRPYCIVILLLVAGSFFAQKMVFSSKAR